MTELEGDAYHRGYEDGKRAAQDEIYMEGYLTGQREGVKKDEDSTAQKLREIVKERGPIPSEDAKNLVLDLGLSARGLNRAKRAAGVKSVKIGDQWHWEIPDRHEVEMHKQRATWNDGRN